MKELEAERADGGLKDRKKLYMLCVSPWNERYSEALKEMDPSGEYDIYPVIPDSWKDMGYEAKLRTYRSCGGIVYRSCGIPEDLELAVTLFPVVSRDMLVKTALCISDTYETCWISACIEKGSRIVFSRSGLARFSGREQPAYRKRIMDYCRQVLEYGIEICSFGELAQSRPYEAGDSAMLWAQKPDIHGLPVSEQKKKRVITSSNVEEYASGGVIYLQQGDIVTDLAKDRAKFLNIVFR